ncbi:MAG: class I SAM-dependent methyltransferase [Bacillota bacterium]
MEDHFDTWADTYNQSVHTIDREGKYPFAGYTIIKTLIFNTLTQGKKKRILDMGVGTGEITRPLHDKGHAIVGVDASEKMLEKAKRAMPSASFILGDFFSALEALEGKFDAILFNYSIHHLSTQDQKRLIKALASFLHPEGIILIGDVMKENRTCMDGLRKKYIDRWDDDEHYPVYDEFLDEELETLYKVSYHEVSHCAGTIRLIKR